MRIRWGLIVLVAIGVEVTAIATLVLLVFLFGPADAAGAQAYAEKLADWVGPIAGFVMCIGGGWLVARRTGSRHILNGLALGACVALIDVALLLVGGATFRWLFVLSNAGKVVAGTLGGWLAAAGSAHPPAESAESS